MKFPISIFFITLIILVTIESVVSVCNHPIYCNGTLLSTVQLSQVFNDSKTFVDMPMRFSSQVILDRFESLLGNSSSVPSQDVIMSFLQENFYDAGYEVQPVQPVDWLPHPPFVKTIKQQELRIFAQDIHNKWLNLARVFNYSGLCDECYSSIPVENPFIIAGSRFREYYYWDSYWVIHGLLVSDMTETARGMLMNLASLISDYGFIPNGGRIYYLDRSQPPLFSQMVKIYFDQTKDITFLEFVLPILDQEYQWWMNERSYSINGHTLNLYNVSTNVPRPESYYEDYTMADESFTTDDEKTFFYSSIASAAESGWDFSSRWFKPGSMQLQTIETIDVLPVDLNSILYLNEKTLSDFHFYMGNLTQKEYYSQQADLRAEAIQYVLWNPEINQWLDYNIQSSQWQNTNFYTSNLMPLFAKVQKNSNSNDYLNSTVLEEIIQGVYSVLMQYPGGVPTSLINTTQQWDMPNSWPPLQYFIIEILYHLNGESTKYMANDLINRWVTTNYCGWKDTLQSSGGMMFEKYDALNVGVPGGGGEYVVQDGFGWTNGVILYLLNKFSSSITLTSQC
ncbi:Trehalase precursor [Tieghemostelium lacteum]|uniref:Trehalase n=1 Tax=Tieghemostelium lacteum TaxID=361077 RepID=A0A151Z7I7_TIELA|nr:Trehalase precursor [Tieghemostelium lacteum]|eukprot:KYQ89897.1 Trehalase precursor [Tieghemostelium lacteum]